MKAFFGRVLSLVGQAGGPAAPGGRKQAVLCWGSLMFVGAGVDRRASRCVDLVVGSVQGALLHEPARAPPNPTAAPLAPSPPTPPCALPCRPSRTASPSSSRGCTSTRGSTWTSLGGTAWWAWAAPSPWSCRPRPPPPPRCWARSRRGRRARCVRHGAPARCNLCSSLIASRRRSSCLAHAACAVGRSRLGRCLPVRCRPASGMPWLHTWAEAAC